MTCYNLVNQLIIILRDGLNQIEWKNSIKTPRTDKQGRLCIPLWLLQTDHSATHSWTDTGGFSLGTEKDLTAQTDLFSADFNSWHELKKTSMENVLKGTASFVLTIRPSGIRRPASSASCYLVQSLCIESKRPPHHNMEMFGSKYKQISLNDSNFKIFQI